MVLDLAPSIQKTGVPLIEVFIGGEKHLFILDTGATTNLISSALKDKCKYAPAGEGMTYSFEGAAAECPIIRLSYSLKGTSHESDFTVTDASTFGVFQEESDMLVEGIMGLPFLVEHRCVIDYIYGNVTLIV